MHWTIRDVDPSSWDALAGDNALAAHGWLLTVERCWLADFEPLYIVVALDEEVVGGTVCYVTRQSPRSETLDDLLWGRLRGAATRAGASFLPALVCGPARGYGWHIGVRVGLHMHHQQAVRRRILDAMEEEADRRGLPLSFTLVLGQETELRALLGERGYFVTRNMPIAVLDVPWVSMEEYLRHLPRKRRLEYQRQQRRNHEAGTRFEILDKNEEWDHRFLTLLDRNVRTHGATGLSFDDAFIGELRKNLGDRALRIVARKGGAISGAYLVLRQGEAALAYAVGVDPDLGRNDFTYFQLAYHVLIDYAIRYGIKRIYYGRGMYDLKVRRGCFLVESSVYTRVKGSRRPLYAAWYGISSRWNRYKLLRQVKPDASYSLFGPARSG
jgi:predicted N-acyltransferase